jgi:phosphatidylserine/phosphatidylglycerophosphate/cardiolipin synthase-like enzyme
LLSANSSLYCALYDLDDPALIDAFDSQAEKLSNLGIVGDEKYTPKKPYLMHDTPSGQMHNKFCIADNRYVLTGSMNFATTELTKNQNNLLVIDSPHLAQKYTAEYNELASKIFRSGEPALFTEIWGEPKMHVYFCPEDWCEDTVIDILSQAETEIVFMTFSFTSNPIAAQLLKSHASGVHLEGIYYARMSAYSTYEILKNANISVSLYDASLLHHKVFIIDKEIVITGSYNPTTNGNARNDENMLVLYSPALAQKYLETYAKLKADALD